ncbi:hypothetical protein LTR08_003405 [Meristemomyces frigidus]|nr:hypothetical protein LTR08_003405 [Meristemomyces frigidus]
MERPTPRSQDSSSLLRPRPLNFSRPRPVPDGSGTLQHDTTGGAIRGVSALHNPSRERLVELQHDTSGGAVKGIRAFHGLSIELPAEPRFSIDSQRTTTTQQTTSTTSEESAASQFAWDGQLGELRSERRPSEYEQDQRWSRGHPNNRTTTWNSQATVGSGSTAVASDQPSVISELPGSQPPPLPKKKGKIVQRISIDQQSSRMSVSSRGTAEDDTSHHTVSVDCEGGYVPEGNWSSSGYDVSGLSIAEITKLRKKGINPALYAEMKAARKGKNKWVGPLVGNSFI